METKEKMNVASVGLLRRLYPIAIGNLEVGKSAIVKFEKRLVEIVKTGKGKYDFASIYC